MNSPRGDRAEKSRANESADQSAFLRLRTYS